MYVGNLDYSTQTKWRICLPGRYCATEVITRMDGKIKGFGFVEMESEEQAKAAIEKLNRSNLKEL